MTNELTQTEDQPLALLLRDPEKLKAIPIDTVTKLAELDLAYKAEAAKREFNQAVAGVAIDMPALPKSKRNPQNGSMYTPEEEVDAALSPILKKHGITVSSWPEPSTQGPEHTLITMVIRHVGGHEERIHFDAPIDYKGLKGSPNKTKIQGVGASLSYATRLMKLRFFNIDQGGSPMAADTDGNQPRPQSGFVSEEQIADLKALGQEVNADIRKFLKIFNISRLEELPADRFREAVRVLESHRG